MRLSSHRLFLFRAASNAAGVRALSETIKTPGIHLAPMSGRGRETEFTLSEVTAVFEAREDYAEPLTASEVADELGCSRRTALNKLHELGDGTALRSKKVGGRSRVWWIPVEV
jgi:CRP-like cAMP-binding protein